MFQDDWKCELLGVTTHKLCWRNDWKKKIWDTQSKYWLSQILRYIDNLKIIKSKLWDSQSPNCDLLSHNLTAMNIFIFIIPSFPSIFSSPYGNGLPHHKVKYRRKTQPSSSWSAQVRESEIGFAQPEHSFGSVLQVCCSHFPPCLVVKHVNQNVVL